MFDDEDPKLQNSRKRSKEKIEILNAHFRGQDQTRGEISDGPRRGETGRPQIQPGDQPEKKPTQFGNDGVGAVT